MLDIKFIRENKEKVIEAMANRRTKVDIDRLLELDIQRRQLITQLDNLRKEQNELTEVIAKNRTQENIEKAKTYKEKLVRLEKDLERAENDFNNLMIQVPNIPLESVPIGKDEKDNKVIREVGKKPMFDFQPKDYLELAEKLDIIDMERAGKVSGSRFGYIKGKLAQMEFALVQLAFDILTKEKFIPVVPPVFIKSEMMWGMGYIEKQISTPTPRGVGAPTESVGEYKNQKYSNEEVYFLRDDDLVLVGTAEQSIGPMHQNEIFDEKDLPRRYIGFSSCFRREAGSYGKDTKGILRVHQFDKVEMFSYTRPEDSDKEHKFMLSMEEKLMQLLEIPYRVVQLCTADLAKPSVATYDIEAWLPGQNQYRETHSTSNTTDFQARRLNIRYKNCEGKNVFVHMLNGTTFAIGRTLIAIIENFQTKEGKIKVPRILQKHLSFKEIP